MRANVLSLVAGVPVLRPDRCRHDRSRPCPRFSRLFGAWDPTLAFVMGGAVLVMVVAWLVDAGKWRRCLRTASTCRRPPGSTRA